jgi:hypothetical protein
MRAEQNFFFRNTAHIKSYSFASKCVVERVGGKRKQQTFNKNLLYFLVTHLAYTLHQQTAFGQFISGR